MKGHYQKNLSHQIKTRQKKIKDISKKINKKEKVLNSLVNGNVKIYPGAREFKKGSIYGIRWIAVFLVNPAYTSQMGKFKYMKPKGLSVHLAAAYVIARRRMGFSEKVPPAGWVCERNTIDAGQVNHLDFLSKY